jgi:hypothetical protein
MLTMHIPMLLALLGTALMAVVIFAPSRVPAAVTASFAPPPAPPAVERWEPSTAWEPSPTWEPSPAWQPWPAFEPCSLPATERREPPPPEPPLAHAPAWPALIDRRASGCDAAARLAIVEALASVRTPWSEELLYRALDDESDASVRAAVVAALRATARYPAGLA